MVSDYLLFHLFPTFFPLIYVPKFPYDREEFLVEMCFLLSLLIFGTYIRGKKVGNKLNDNHLGTFSGMYRILPPQFYWLQSPISFFLSSWDIPPSFHNAECICQYRVSIFTFPLFPVKFSPSLVLYYLHFFILLSSDLFILSIHHACWMDSSCKFHQISLFSCAWRTNTNIGHVW